MRFNPGRSRGYFPRKLGRLKPDICRCLNEEREGLQLAKYSKDRAKNLADIHRNNILHREEQFSVQHFRLSSSQGVSRIYTKALLQHKS